MDFSWNVIFGGKVEIVISILWWFSAEYRAEAIEQ